MASSVPTEKQFRKLLVLAGGSIALAPRRREWNPLLRRGWVEAVAEDDGHRSCLPPLRLTADGYRAIAEFYDRNGGLPELKKGEFRARLMTSRKQQERGGC